MRVSSIYIQSIAFLHNEIIGVELKWNVTEQATNLFDINKWIRTEIGSGGPNINNHFYVWSFSTRTEYGRFFFLVRDTGDPLKEENDDHIHTYCGRCRGGVSVPSWINKTE